jgi:phosphoserine phosphatase
MPLVATLIADPDRNPLSREVVRDAMAALGAIETRELGPQAAIDLLLPDSTSEDEAKTALARLLSGTAVDFAVQPVDGRRKKALIADMDSTMIGQECIDELAEEAGLRDRVAAITQRTMRGEIDFEPALRERVGLLAGLPTSVIARVLESRIRLAPGGRELVATMRANGAWTALVSGGFTAFTGPVSRLLGFDEHQANILEERDGFLAGTVSEPILGREAKLAALQRIAQRLGITPRDFLAVGDGANDLDMIRAAGAGVAIHAKPVVAEAAPFRIDHCGLEALLYLQGYSRAEFAA